MVGTQEFNSACFYRYANIDFRQLQLNLRGDRELALEPLESVLRPRLSLAHPSEKPVERFCTASSHQA